MIEIVTACDDNYVQHLCVTLCSLLENTAQRDKINIYVIDGGILETTKQKFLNFFLETYNLSIIFTKIDSNLYQKFNVSHHLTLTTYYRISIPSILPSHVQKALYLDCDLIVKDDIQKLWSFPLDDFLLGAVHNPYVSIDKNNSYFNAGVMLINVELWRRFNISEIVIKYISENPDKIILWDQDALNAIIKESWLKLPPQWNQQSTFFDFYFKTFYARYLFDQEEFNQALFHPSIVHYSSMLKPWQYDNIHPYKQEYYHYLNMTPWSAFRPEYSFIKLVKKIIKQYTPKFIFETLKIPYEKIKKIFGKD